MSSEQKRLYFKQDKGSSDNVGIATGNRYIDLAAALSAANNKQYHHVAKDGTPLCYSYTIHSMSNTPITATASPTNWAVRNAIKMTAAGWKKQLKNSNVKMSELPVYGKRMRLAFDRAALSGVSGKESQLDMHMYPLDAAQASLFNGYTDTSGDTVTYSSANEVTQVVIADPDPGDEPLEKRVTISNGGTHAAAFDVVPAYIAARRNMTTEDADTLPAITSEMSTLFATSEELSEDVIEAITGERENRPYSEADGVAVISAHVDPAIQVTSASGLAPCGLLKFTSLANSDIFMIDVHAIYEM